MQPRQLQEVQQRCVRSHPSNCSELGQSLRSKKSPFPIHHLCTHSQCPSQALPGCVLRIVRPISEEMRFLKAMSILRSSTLIAQVRKSACQNIANSCNGNRRRWMLVKSARTLPGSVEAQEGRFSAQYGLCLSAAGRKGRKALPSSFQNFPVTLGSSVPSPPTFFLLPSDSTVDTQGQVFRQHPYGTVFPLLHQKPTLATTKQLQQ